MRTQALYYWMRTFVGCCDELSFRPCQASRAIPFVEVRCDMGHIPLNAHTYYTRVHFGDLHREIARFSNVHAITIQEYDVYGWGSALPSVRSWGHFFWAPNWDIRPD